MDGSGGGAVYEPVTVATARWIRCADAKKLAAFRAKAAANLAIDGGKCLAYLAPSQVNLALTRERHPEIEFLATREH